MHYENDNGLLFYEGLSDKQSLIFYHMMQGLR